jgi:outer membrane immunogenic protein
MRLRNAGLLCAIISACALSTASAADRPVYKMPVYKAPVYKARPVLMGDLWSGFYFGGHIGGGWGRNEFSDPTGGLTAAGAFSGSTGSGFLGGPQLGFNWQFGSYVFGIQGDASFTDIRSSVVAPLFVTTAINTRTTSIATVTGRFGYAVDHGLFYAKGGGAWVHNRYDAIDTVFPLDATGSHTHSGYVVGAGWEYALAPNWSIFVEYDYVGVNTRTVTLTDPALGPMPVDAKQNLQMVKTGFNFKVGAWPWPLPR